jgi:hypothetical protein
VQALEVRATEHDLDRGLDAAAHAQGRERRRIARAAQALGHAQDVLGHAADDVHVGGRGARVLAGDVATAQAIDEATERLHEHAPVGDRTLGVAPDDRLAAAVGQAGQRGLVGHAARQAHDVQDRFVARVVREHARAAHGRTQAGVVDGHGRAKVRLLIVEHVHLARTHLRRDLEYAHQSLHPLHRARST